MTQNNDHTFFNKISLLSSSPEVSRPTYDLQNSLLKSSAFKRSGRLSIRRVVYQSNVPVSKVLPGVERRIGSPGETRRLPGPPEFYDEEYNEYGLARPFNTVNYSYRNVAQVQEQFIPPQPMEVTTAVEEIYHNDYNGVMPIKQVIESTEQAYEVPPQEYENQVEQKFEGDSYKDEIIQELSCQVAMLIGVNRAYKHRINKMLDQQVREKEAVQDIEEHQVEGGENNKANGETDAGVVVGTEEYEALVQENESMKNQLVQLGASPNHIVDLEQALEFSKKNQKEMEERLGELNDINGMLHDYIGNLLHKLNESQE